MRNGRRVLARAHLREDHRAAALDLDRDRDEREERGEEEEREERDGEVERPLEDERRVRDVPGVVFDHREVGDVVQLHRGAEHAARRRDDAQLDLLGAAERDELRERLLVERLRREHDPVDVEDARLVAGGRNGLLLGDDVHVDVGEELELAARSVGKRPAPHDERPLPRHDPPPEEARERPERDRGDDRDQPLTHRHREVGRAGGRQPEEDRQRCDARTGPDEDRGELVGGEVPDRPLVAVVEAVELREEDPHRDEERRPDRVHDRPRRQDAERERHDERGRHVGEREHPAEQRVAPGALAAREPRPAVRSAPRLGRRDGARLVLVEGGRRFEDVAQSVASTGRGVAAGRWLARIMEPHAGRIPPRSFLLHVCK